MIRLIALGAVAIVLSGCGSARGPLDAPPVDMRGVEQAKYANDLEACRAEVANQSFSYGDPMIRCLRARGYTVHGGSRLD